MKRIANCVLLAAAVTLFACSGSSVPTNTPPVIPPPPPPPPAPIPLDPTPPTDAGGGWTLVLNRPISSKYEGVAFPDSLHGWVISDRGDILATSNGGANWSLQASALGQLRSLDFIDNQRGFTGTLSGELYKTVNGGLTWTYMSGSLPKYPVGTCGITHFGNHVYIVGRYTGATDFYSSQDAGATWQYQNLNTLAQGLVDVAFLDDTTGLIGGMGLPVSGAPTPPVILKTSDGGQSWHKIFSIPAGGGWVWKLFPLSPTLVYASVESTDGTYRVLKSTDAGETWAIKIVATGKLQGSQNGLQGIGFVDENTGWVGGFLQGMYKTTDGGETWSYVNNTSNLINKFRRAGTTLMTAGTKGIMRFDGP